MKCGYKRMHERCPANDNKCNYCHKKGHFVSVCRKKAGAHIVEDMCGFEQSADNSGAHLINIVTDAERSDWWESMEVDGTNIEMQIDTGATKSLMPFNVFRDMNCNQPITKTAHKVVHITQSKWKATSHPLLGTKANA